MISSSCPLLLQSIHRRPAAEHSKQSSCAIRRAGATRIPALCCRTTPSWPTGALVVHIRMKAANRGQFVASTGSLIAAAWQLGLIMYMWIMLEDVARLVYWPTTWDVAAGLCSVPNPPHSTVASLYLQVLVVQFVVVPLFVSSIRASRLTDPSMRCVISAVPC